MTFLKVTVRTGWLVGSCFMVVSMCSINIFYGARKDFTTVEAAFYSSIHRAMWSAGVGWVLLACITDNSGNYSQQLSLLTITDQAGHGE